MRHPSEQTREHLRWTVTAALMAAFITLVTAYVLHVPFPGGYVHIGDTLIYLAACLLPLPYAVAAGAIGAGLADLLTYPVWVVPTLLIKALVALLFTSRQERILCRRNILAALAACLVSPAAYGAAAVLLYGTPSSFLPQFLGTLVQAVSNGVLFLFLAPVLDRTGLKRRLQS